MLNFTKPHTWVAVFVVAVITSVQHLPVLFQLILYWSERFANILALCICLFV